MSPALALKSPVFLFFATLAGGLLIVGGIVLSLLKRRGRKGLDHAWAAYCGWLWIVPLLLAVYFLGREAVIVFLTAIALLCIREFARAAGLEADRIISGAVYVGVGALGASCLLSHPKDGTPGWYDLFMVVP